MLRVFDASVKKYGSELNQDFLDECLDIENFIGEQCDLLKEEPFKNKLFKYQVFNYPFSIKDKEHNTVAFNDKVITIKSNKDAYFLLSILNKLENDGIAVGLAFPGIAYRQQEMEVRKAIVLSGYLREVELIDNDNNFADTGISTLKMIFVKSENKKRNVIFRYKDKSRIVSFEELEKEDFNLNTQTYIEEEVKPLEKTFTMFETIDNSVGTIKKNIEYTNQILELDYMLGESTKEEFDNNKKLFRYKLNKVINE